MQKEMHYIHTIWKNRSFSKAAEELFITQPALSAAVKRVEDEIGMPIFCRNTKPLELTNAGEIYLQKIEYTQQLDREFESQLSDLVDMNVGEIRIGATFYCSVNILPPVLKLYTERYPNIHVRIFEMDAPNLMKNLAAHKLDLTFCSPKTNNIQFQQTPGITDYILLAVPSQFPIPDSVRQFGVTSSQVHDKHFFSEKYPWVSLKEFKDFPFVTLSPGHIMRHTTDALFEDSGISPNVIMECEQFVTGYQMAIQGICAAFLYHNAIQDTCDDILYFKLNPAYSARKLNMATNKKYYLPIALKRFMELFEEYYSNNE